MNIKVKINIEGENNISKKNIRQYDKLKEIWVTEILPKTPKTGYLKIQIDFNIKYGDINIDLKCRIDVSENLSSDKKYNPLRLIRDFYKNENKFLKAFNSKENLCKLQTNNESKIHKITKNNKIIKLMHLFEVHESFNVERNDYLYTYKFMDKDNQMIDKFYHFEISEKWKDDNIKYLSKKFKKNVFCIFVGISAYTLISSIACDIDKIDRILVLKDNVSIYFYDIDQASISKGKTSFHIDVDLGGVLNELIESKCNRYVCSKYETSVQYQKNNKNEGFWIEDNQSKHSIFVEMNQCKKIIEFYDYYRNK